MQLAVLAGTMLSGLLVLRATSSSPKREAPGAPALPPELERLGAWVGTWDAEVTMMGQTTKGRETCRLDCGGHWLITEHEGSFMGTPFQGRGLTGFDAAKGAYSGVWIDSSGGPMSVFSDGRFAKDGKSFSAQVDALDMSGKPARFEYLSKFPDARTRSFEIFQLDGAKKELQMSIRYTKRG
jgi:hypothetical protein